MVRGLIHASVACLLVVCVASISVETRADRPHVGKGSIAAGRYHSVIATPEGRVLAWGGGGRGQIGDGGLSNRLLPTTVPDLRGIIGVAAGAAHTVAVNREGDVYAWGANSFGRLGDGTRHRRAKPVRVRGLAGITQVAAGQAHTLALSADGRVYAWGRNTEGQLGTGNKVTSLVPVRVRDLADVVSIAAGDRHSLAVTRSGRLFAWGSNQFSMLGDGTTKDRVRPVPVGLNDVVAVAGGSAHSLALQSNGRVSSWGRGTHGQLGTGSTRVASQPVLVAGVKATAIAAGRSFSAAVRDDGLVVTWGANESGQLGDRTTTRRLRPVVVEAVTEARTIALGDAHAIAVTASGDVRTWGAGDAGQLGNGATADQSAASEIISDVPDWGEEPGDVQEPPDTVPPSITASTSPPIGEGWMTTPVTVSFQCADDVAVASCSAPVTVASDGRAQLVVGTAVDLAGNRASVTVSLNLDLSPPVLTIAAPADLSVIDADVVEVIGSASDLASGLVDLRCNSQQVQVIEGQVRCSVSLHAGRNDIVLHAIDGVGRNASAGIAVIRKGAGSELRLTPVRRAMAVTEIATLSLRDEAGVAVEQAVWSSSNEAVVALSDSDPPIITAVGIGSATITADKNGATATASIDVSPELVAGATRWTLPALTGLTSKAPLFTHRVDASVPHLFTVETKQWDTATLRAVTSDGEALWLMHSPGIPMMGDSFGGVVSMVFDEDGNPRAYARIGGGSIRSWRYQSSGELGRPAQAPDGTIYAIEHLPGGFTSDGQRILDKYGIVIDGRTGALISRTLFRREESIFTANWDGMVLDSIPPVTCRSLSDGWAPETLDPVVGSDGLGYFVVRRHRIHKRADCVEPFLRRPDRTIEMGIDLVVLSPDVAPRTVNLHSTNCVGELGTTLPCDLPVRPVQVIPDGIGATLVTWERGTHMVGQSVFVERSLTRVNDTDAVDRPVAPRFSIGLMGQAGLAFTLNGEWSAMDVTTGDIKWAAPLPNLAVLAARPDGGFATVDFVSGALKMIDASGAVESTHPFGLDWRAVQHSGDWIGLRGNQLTAVVGDFDDATRFNATRGNTHNQQAVRLPGYGIWLKTHNAFGPVPIQHASLRVTPFNQDWLLQNRGLFESCTPQSNCVPLGEDVFGNLFFTIGAGAGSQDTNVQCNGLLTKGFNRPNDVRTPPTGPLQELPIDFTFQGILVNSILDRYRHYANLLGYYCFPEDRPGFYNSNSFVHGLLHAAGVPHDETAPSRLPVPGWATRVPTPSFFPNER